MTKRSLATLFLMAVLIVAAGPSTLVFAQRTDRARLLGKRLMCMCGCNQILTECNHVGCTVSSSMLHKLDQLVARNDPDDLTLQAFVQEYGTRALAEPPAKGFNLLGWTMPRVVLLFGVLLVCRIIFRWRRERVASAAPECVPPDLLARARRQADQESED